MKLRELLDKWSLTKLKISAGFLDAEFEANDQDRDAAWSMYVELLTRITTQALPAGRVTPRWSTGRQAVALPASMAGEPGSRGRVNSA